MLSRFGLALVLVLAAAAHAPGLFGEFVVDDTPVIRENPRMRSLAFLPDYFSKSFWENTALEKKAAPMYRPLNLAYLALNYRLWGEQPFGYHLAGLIVHLANTALVFVLLGMLLPRARPAARLAGAALFGVHPAAVESVAWISGVTDPLATLFLLGALLAYERFRDRAGVAWLIVCCLLLLFALLSKEVAIAFPLLAAGLDLARRRRLSLPALAAMGLPIAVYLLARTLALAGDGGLGRIDPGQLVRLMDFGVAYLSKLLAPLSLEFYLAPPDAAVAPLWGIAVVVVVLAALGLGLWRQAPDQARPSIYGIAWTAIALWPGYALALYDAGFFAVRFLYLPIVGLAIVLAALLAAAIPRAGRYVQPAAAAVIAIFAALTVAQTRLWRDDHTVYASAARATPLAAAPYAGMARYFLSRGDEAQALVHYEQALERARDPRQRVEFLEALGTIHGERGRAETSERYFRELAGIAPRYSPAWVGLGNNAWLRGNTGDAALHWERALAADPRNYEAAQNLVMAYRRLGDEERALRYQNVASGLARPRSR